MGVGIFIHRENVYIAITIVVVVGKDGAGHFNIGQYRKEIVAICERAVGIVYIEVCYITDSVYDEQVRPGIVIIIDPVEPQIMNGHRRVGLIPQTGIDGNVGKEDVRLRNRGRDHPQNQGYNTKGPGPHDVGVPGSSSCNHGSYGVCKSRVLFRPVHVSYVVRAAGYWI